MSNSRERKANPKVQFGPDYVLRRVHEMASDWPRFFYTGMTEGQSCCWSASREYALKMKGPGLASAERALKRRGYVVERVRVDE
jgi:hypothetical protein